MAIPMQKLFNVMAAASFVMSGALVGGTVVLHAHPVDGRKLRQQGEVNATESILKQCPSQRSLRCRLPTQTGLRFLCLDTRKRLTSQ